MITRRLTITGMVQGIGYRPYVARLAESLGICGNVINASGVVVITATASRAQLDILTKKLGTEPPPGAVIWEIKQTSLPYTDFAGFAIEESKDKQSEEVLYIPTDLSVCDQCVKEFSDPANRRYNYPFISCASCGPRYSIIRKIPYDRCNTTMSVFDMCPDCGKEYISPKDVRRHAQTISCRFCGPRLILKEYKINSKFNILESIAEFEENSFIHASDTTDAIIRRAAQIIKDGGILAIRDIGGYHLACSPFDDTAVKLLRTIKDREEKPFAIMAESLEQAEQFCVITQQEADLLRSSARPVVLCQTRSGYATDSVTDRLSDEVAKGSPYTGIMLYCNTLQLLLLKQTGALIMTSANSSGEPIIKDNDIMCQWLAKQTELFPALHAAILTHDRDILTMLDDSVVRIIQERKQFFRRSRGYVPAPVMIQSSTIDTSVSTHVQTDTPVQSPIRIFAAGADMKAVFALRNGNAVYMSQYFGDLDNAAVYEAYCQNQSHMQELLDLHPDIFVCDLHPAYISSAFTQEMAQRHNGKLIQIQHHHAHIASVIAEHKLTGKVFGIAFDGTGYGTDGAVWGSEFLLCENNSYTRIGHLEEFRLIGGDENMRNADRILYSLLCHCNLTENAIQWIQWIANEKENLHIIRAAMDNRLNVIRTTSMGRLFDAVSALLGICHYSSYEGQAATELEYAAMKADKPYPLQLPVLHTKDGLVGDIRSLLKNIMIALTQNIAPENLALGFIKAVAQFATEIAYMSGSKQVALSGGCFQNGLLLRFTLEELAKNPETTIYINEQVPTGDGGIALGQAYLAGIE